jgi:uncharacterized protein with HEPN domain
MPRDSKLYLEDIQQAIEKIENYTVEVSLVEIQQNSMLLDAVLYNLEIIGEAAKHLPEDLKAKSPEIEWRKITGLRDIVAHEYFGISKEIIWDILKNKLPGLRDAVTRILEEGS